MLPRSRSAERSPSAARELRLTTEGPITSRFASAGSALTRVYSSCVNQRVSAIQFGSPEMSGSLMVMTETTELRRRFLITRNPASIEAVPPARLPTPRFARIPSAARRCRRSIWYSQVGQKPSPTYRTPSSLRRASIGLKFLYELVRYVSRTLTPMESPNSRADLAGISGTSRWADAASDAAGEAPRPIATTAAKRTTRWRTCVIGVDPIAPAT